MFSFAPLQTVAIVPDATRVKLTEVTSLPSQAGLTLKGAASYSQKRPRSPEQGL
jgi:hypothetical protein